MNRVDISTLSFDGLIDREWIASNGLGGYASSTLCGLNTRKYHGLLVAAMAPPVRRMVLLSHVDEAILVDGKPHALSCNEYPGAIFPQGHRLLRAFSAAPFPRWAYQGDGFTIEKSLQLLRGENTVCLSYTLLAGDKSVDLEIHPKLALRGIHELMFQWNGRLGAQNFNNHQVKIAASAKTPELFFAHDGQFHPNPFWYLNTIYRRENERGYAGLEDLWMPGAFRWKLSPGQTVYLACSTDAIDLGRITSELERQALEVATPTPTDGMDEHFDALLRAGEMFIAQPPDQTPVYVTAQFPWSSPSGRSSLIAFAGLFMVPGRFDEGRRLLRSLAADISDGLIPTEFSETGAAPLYNGADTSLWFINAVYDYWRYTGDHATTADLFHAVMTIIQTYREGTKLGITVDSDGLVTSRDPAIPTSWMDAMLPDLIVTPRAGATVELNALWYNALRIASSLAAMFATPARGDELSTLATSVESAFNRRFWNADLKSCYDVVDGDKTDSSIRPNQLLAISLPFAVLSTDRHAQALQTVTAELLTPYGLRTLSRRDAAYQGRYTGNVISRDRAQHQGSVYPWLLGPLVTASLRTTGRTDHAVAQCRGWLEACLTHLQTDGIGQLCELFDGDSPHHPGGAIASAMSIGELLRCYAQDILGIQPNLSRPRTPNPTTGGPVAGARPV